MTRTLAAIWRYPIKSHGREKLDRVALTAGQALPWDRAWAVAHEAAKLNDGLWVSCANFSRGAKAPQLMAISARLDDDSGRVTLSHPDLADLNFNPDTDSDLFLKWVEPLMPTNRAASAKIIRATAQAMTDTSFPSISINGTASLQALGQQMNQTLAAERFRGNLWVEGLDPWEEFDWVGKTVEIGGATIEVRERIGRCLATTANPETGERDADTLGALKAGWGHTDFGVYGVVLRGGTIQVTDTVKVLT